jgi:hypothetical protein
MENKILETISEIQQEIELKINDYNNKIDETNIDQTPDATDYSSEHFSAYPQRKPFITFLANIKVETQK